MSYTERQYITTTDLFFDEDGNPSAVVRGYQFHVAAQNHKYTGDFTPANVDFIIVIPRKSSLLHVQIYPAQDLSCSR